MNQKVCTFFYSSLWRMYRKNSEKIPLCPSAYYVKATRR